MIKKTWRSFIDKVRGSEDRMSEEEFQDHVVGFLRSEYPEGTFEPGHDPRVVRMGEVELGLQNLYSTYRVNRIEPADLRELYSHHFTEVMNRIAAELEQDSLSWEAVSSLIRPQLMPAEYCEQAPIVNMPFCEGVAVGLVVDHKERYSYVRYQDLEDWDRSSDEVLDRALENLEEESSGIQMQSTDGPDRFIGIETKDGYDAVRLLLPKLREFISEHLGEPFFAGVPNRDFLICWATDCSKEFQAFAAQKLQKDFENQPYELTPRVLTVYNDSIEEA